MYVLVFVVASVDDGDNQDLPTSEPQGLCTATVDTVGSDVYGPPIDGHSAWGPVRGRAVIHRFTKPVREPAQVVHRLSPFWGCRDLPVTLGLM